ncbi:MAG: hypothetical protein TR69_WS6001001055 [candidate division WS6 bacterium OLB20]|uniref:Uncharacterized protein n=1 Tax=candidate division WS6 bacterium OLB20 TaxID=1617426 RepID=A0A136LZE5_9BACT|nr:MAG: hypothetical protein TR69_WS6001001055 [candidate division WS6 bacterium OLB20]
MLNQTAKLGSRTFLIDTTDFIGATLYIIDSKVLGAADDYYQDTLEDCKKFALTYFQVPLDSWSPVDEDHQLFSDKTVVSTHQQPITFIEHRIILELENRGVDFNIDRSQGFRINIVKPTDATVWIDSENALQATIAGKEFSAIDNNERVTEFLSWPDEIQQ